MSIRGLLQTEPARVIAVTAALLTFLVELGLLVLTDVEVDNLAAAVGLLFQFAAMIAGGEVIRGRVTSPATAARDLAAIEDGSYFAAQTGNPTSPQTNSIIRAFEAAKLRHPELRS